MNQNKNTATLPKPPEIPVDVRDASSLQGVVEEALTRQEDVLGLRFADEVLQDVAATGLEFSGCVFQRCRFLGNEWKRLCFVDCVLDHCDLSNETFVQASFQRVRLEDCRMTGVSLKGSSLMNAVMQGCAMDFAAFAETKLNRVMFRECRLRESVWDHVTLLQTRLEGCDLGHAQWTFTPLQGMDLRSCEISGLMIDLLDLRGVRVTPLQALELCRLLKLEIAEEDV